MKQFLLGAFIAVVIMGLLWLWRAKKRREFWNYVSDALRAISKGNYQVRLYNTEGKSDGDVVASVNEMARVIEEQVQQLSQERDVLRHILHSMTTGVVYIASGGKVTAVNEAAERMFRRPAEQWRNREHTAAFGHYHLSAAIDNALLFGTDWHSELKLRDNLTVDVRLIVIPTSRERVGDTAYDVLVLLNDVSEWKRLERMRSEFVANVSHELKTPIAAIRGFAETLLDGDVDAETQQSFLRTIYDESNRMSNLVTDLLELSKLEGAEHLIQPGRVVLQEIVEQAVHRLRPEAEKHQVTLEAEPSGDLTVWGSAERLLQVFLNLLSNAIYYTPSGGKVTVWTDVLVDRVKVHVTDTGIGIPEADQERVFERFYRVDRARSRASGGTGLGLAIVKHIINAHGGQVGVSSEVGRGSDFWFTLSRLEGALQEVQS
ncbi:PAS domain-containing protein [Alicyclobacillus cycloheptanicus]|uniref:histidine kinase n=1 Tax=Alicyclobacillus cycloheptanicus TaxID=1457 RepID=A0ABT9XLB2_9BACL|nr:ATP-binding protein [Alicyclobacillus cycloheptanicus]MDQ0191097.1 two-component system phosphate regulon sensor histidine kinase PhoR [Alicyclobacillus cycloheptanicus]WDL99823.1 PAS domain-containing protein [Alicyclobacillus cycloheptanicus]